MPLHTYPERATKCCTRAVAGSAAPATERTAEAAKQIRRSIRFALALLFLLYLRAVGFAPVYDDNVISQWTSGWRDVPKFFAHDIFGSDGRAHSVYYRPISQTWAFLIGRATGGAPGWLHLSAVLVHLTVVVLAFVLGRKLFRDERLALLTALLFGLHPTKVESVAWIGSSYVDGLGGLLFFATLIAFVNWRECMAGGRARASWRWLAMSVGIFALAIFTKETMVCVPVLLAAYIWIDPAARAGQPRPIAAQRLWSIVGALLPYAIVSAIYMAIRHRVIRPAGPNVAYLHPTYTLSNLWTAPDAIWWYLEHLLMPWGLAVEYTPRVLEHPSLTGFVLPAAGLIVAAVVAWMLWRRSRSGTAAFLGVWFVLTLAPPVIVAPMVQQHDRYLYLAAYPFCALVACAILRIGKLPSRVRWVMALGVVAVWTSLTWHELGYWDSDATLWARVLQVAPTNLKAQVQMAYIYSASGDSQRALALLDQGLRDHPDSPGIWLTRASILAGNKRSEEAREAYMNVMRVTEPVSGEPIEPGPRANMRAAAAYKLALMDLEAGHFREGEQYARTALTLKPDGVGFHLALAENLRGEGRTAEADRENANELRLRLEQQRRMLDQHR